RPLCGGVAVHRGRARARGDPRTGECLNAPLKTKAQFSWEDPLLLGDELTQDERMVREAAHAYAQGKLAPRVLEAFRHEKTDPEIFREMGEIGLLGPTIPSEYGGPGLNYVSY